MEMAARVKPRNIDPASPMNILAGLKLWGRKPMALPARAAAITVTCGRRSIRAATNMAARAAMEAMPAANPSRPSMRFITFITATTQRTLSG